MKNSLIISIAVAASVAAAMFCSCGVGHTAGGPVPTLDLESAIDNRRSFDLAELCSDVSFVPLDDSRREGLVGAIRKISASNERFYVQDDGREVLLKIFDKEGRYISSRGVFGRGPDEFMSLDAFAVDPGTDNLYITGRTGSMSPTTIVYDKSGTVLFRSDSISGGNTAFFEGRLIVQKDSPAPFDFMGGDDFATSIGTEVPFLETWTSDLRRAGGTAVVDKGAGAAIIMDSEGGEIKSITVLKGSPAILSGNGESLLAKEALGDTLYRYSDGTMTPAWKLHSGKYSAPVKAFGLNPSVPMGDSRLVQEIYVGGRYFFIAMGGNGGAENVMLVIDTQEPSAGFSATGGAEKRPGLYLDGLSFRPVCVRDGNLVGYLQALDIVDNADRLTMPRLKALSDTIKEDSNPVIVIATLK